MTNPGQTENDSNQHESDIPNAQKQVNAQKRPGMADKINEAKQGLWMMLGFIIIILFIVINLFGWPMVPLTLLSALVWYLSGKSQKLVFKAMHEVLLSVTIGLAIFSVFLLYVRFNMVASDRAALAAESFFLDAYDDLKKLLNHLTVISTIVIVTTLLIIDRYRKRAHAFNRFLSLKTFLSRLSLTLMTITTFTVFSPNPPGGIAQDFNDRVVKDYQVLLRDREEAVAKYVAAGMITKEIEQMPVATKNYYQQLFKTVYEKSKTFNAQDKHLKFDVAEKAAKANFDVKRLKTLLGNVPTGGATNDAIKISSALPESKTQRDAALKVLGDEETKRDKAEALTKEKTAGLKEIFSKVLETITPEMEGIAGAYVGELVSETGDLLFEKAGKMFDITGKIEKLDVFSEGVMDKLPKFSLVNTTTGSEATPGEPAEGTAIDKLVDDQLDAINDERQQEHVEKENKKIEEEGHRASER